MKLFIFIIIVAALLQSSFIPINLCLMLVITRSLVTEDNANLLGAFIGGLTLGLLTTNNLGFWAIIFLLVAKATQSVRKLPIANNVFTVIPTAFVILLIVEWIAQLILGQSLSFFKVVIEAVLCLPFYLIIRFWEERFVVKSGTKLRLK